MLSTLHIENIAVIEQAEISFDRGFNVLTGETGAGKSIVIDAISAILGERASREMIRTGAQKAFVSAIFTGVPELPWFAENQVPYEPELGISREIFADGKNSCRVGGKPVTVSTLRRLGVQLIQIHGQNDSQQLFDEATHIGYLDLFAHDEALLESYRQAYDKVSAVRQEIRRLSMDESKNEREKAQRIEFLKFQIDEIERAELQPGEEEELLERRKVLQNAEKLTDAIESAVAALYGDESSDGASAMIANAAHALERVSRVSDEMRQLSGKLNDLMYTAQDIADELRDKKDDLTYSADELEQIEERLDTLHKLKRKYGGSVEDVIAFCEKAKRQLDEVEFASDRIEQLQKKLSALQTAMQEKGMALSAARKMAAEKLQAAISSELMQLDMPKIQFVCEFSAQQPQENGLDAVRFLMSANVGESLRPLSKVASGGELARIMLAMKNVLAAEDSVGTMIFDEVAYGLRNMHTPEDEVKSRVEEVLRVCGLYPFRSWPISALSYGQRKRVTIASIIEKEGIGDETERKNIASVLYNRLNTTDRETYGYLQLDTTIYYALSLEGKDKTAFDQNLDSPYNTYKYPGLPAGPICCPGLDSIMAAIYPNDTEYYYFAAGKDGVNHFFKTYNEHLAFINSDMYQPD